MLDWFDRRINGVNQSPLSNRRFIRLGEGLGVRPLFTLMLIKRVLIQGFKTFAKRTEFLFDPGLTAIVGPNGSGKSNVVDAVRWCLGEQSFSLLRSKKTSDIIFSGSDKKARLSLAEVSLTLDNSRGEIPIAFTEIEITRRAYRDGENEYLINGKQVRLTDVIELLAQTGLGKRTYALIGQGLIDQVLSFTPEERRALFEEAAGITGYQMKRTTTLRRLEATQQNLTRVQDIIAELSPRLKQLRRQAERAREYEAIAQELRSLLRDWYGYRWHTALRTLADSHALEETLHQQVLARQTALADLNQRIEQLRLHQAQVRGQLGDLHKESSTLHRQAESADRELAVASERLRQLQARIEEGQRELVALRLEEETLRQRQTTLHEAVVAAQAEYQQRQQAVEAIQASVNQRQQEQVQLQQAVETARRALTQVQNKQIECNSRLTQLHERRTTLQRELEAQQRSLVNAEAESAALTSRVATGQEQIGQEEQKASALQAQLTEFEAALGQLRQTLATAEQERQQADRSLDRLQTRFDLLRRLREEGAGYASGVRAILTASGAKGKPALSGILGTIAALVRVPAHLDKAIETALGGAFQDVVTERWEDAREAIEYLKRSGQGRATFLPLDRLHVGSSIAAPRRPGILGNAAQLVDYDERAEAAVLQLLNRIWVAEDMNAARAALDQLSGGQRPTVVTLSGEIIRPGGAMTGGSDHNRRDDSVLARERELRDLPQQVEQAKQQVQQASAQCATHSKQIQTTQLQLDNAKQQLAELARQERQQRQQQEEARRQLDRAQQAARWQNERLAQTQQELAKLDSQESTLRNEQEQMQGSESQAAAALVNAEAAVRALGAAALLQELADRRAAAAEAQGHLRSQQTLQETQRRNWQQIVAQIQGKEQRITALSQEAATLAERIDQLTAHDSSLQGQLTQLNQQIEPLETQATELARQQSSEEQREREAQQSLRKEESNWNNAQLQRQRGEDALHQLRHEIEQDLGLVALEQSDEVAYQPPLPWDKYVEQLPVLESIPETLEEEVRETRARLARNSNVNPDAPREYDEAASRHTFLTNQSNDLEAAAADLRKVIRELDLLMEVAFERTYKAVAEHFTDFFQKLFKGGTAYLELTEPNSMATTGIEIMARPPGKRPQSLALLSGGERALSACALIFAILRVSPTPFCVLDEVDAALDEANVDRFREVVEELSQETQFIIVTHNRRTLEGANAIYGVTMGSDGVSTVISLKLEGDKMVQRNQHAAPSAQERAQLATLEEVVQM